MGLSRTAFLFSISFHTFLFFVFFSLTTFNQRAWLLSLFNKNVALEAQSFVQVDLVGLPEQLISKKINPLLPETPDPGTIKNTNTNKAAPKNTVIHKGDLVIRDKRKEKQAALDEIRDRLKREEALRALKKEAGSFGRGKIKGNKLSQGSASVGTVGTAKDKYIGVLTESIKQQFNVFSWQQKKGLVAEVVLKLQTNGRVLWRKISKPSHDIMYDSAVLQAIDDAQPFPVPDDKSLMSSEIRIIFKP